MNMPALGQPARLLVVLVYTLGLLGVSRIATGEWIPASATSGFWFFAGLLPLLIGDLIVSPFFAKPGDALSFTITALILLFAADVAQNTERESFERILWVAGMFFVMLVLAASLLAILLRPSRRSTLASLGAGSFRYADTYGGARPVYFVVFFLAVVVFHRHEAQEFGWLLGAGLLVVIVRPVEVMGSLVGALMLGRSTGGGVVGELFARQEPGIMLVKRAPGARIEPGDLVVSRSREGEIQVGLHLDWLWLAGETWARVAQVSTTHLTDEDTRVLAQQAGPIGSVNKLRLSDDSRAALSKVAEARIVDRKNDLVGIVAPDTNLRILWFEVIGVATEIEEGQLVETRIGAKNVLYQVIDGISKEEILRERNSYGYARAKARKIGVWNDSSLRFENVRWLPRVNEPVLLVEQATPEPEFDVVGHFPKTKYPVRVELDLLVTHNTAILGILGSGKTYLALELTQRLIVKGTRVICLDITGQYARELEYSGNDTMIADLQECGKRGKDQANLNVEEGGSVNNFRARLSKYLALFLSDACQDRLLILDPAAFEVWRQDSRPFNQQASMATLTPTEICRVIAEETLECLQKLGPSDDARCCLVLEEAHSLVPEWNSVATEGDRVATNGTARAVLQGRKFGLGCLLVTQRTANVTKSILNQCNTIFALRTYDATGMEFLKNYIGEDFTSVLSTLDNRHAVVFGRASSCTDPVLVRLNDRQAFLKTLSARVKP